MEFSLKSDSEFTFQDEILDFKLFQIYKKRKSLELKTPEHNPNPTYLSSHFLISKNEVYNVIAKMLGQST